MVCLLDVLVASGINILEACKLLNVELHVFYRWKMSLDEIQCQMTVTSNMSVFLSASAKINAATETANNTILIGITNNMTVRVVRLLFLIRPKPVIKTFNGKVHRLHPRRTRMHGNFCILIFGQCEQGQEVTK